VPLFNKVTLKLQNGKTFTIVKRNSGNQITGLTYGGRKIDGYFIPHSDLVKGKELVITTR
jgi:putative alpha-1,2-mannosidase